MNDTSKLQALQQQLGYTFSRPELLQLALTHTSARYELNLSEDNQRLEFLGDAVLGLIAAEFGYYQKPVLNEGQLTRLRSYVSSTSALAAIARAINLGPSLILGKGEQMSGGHDKENNLADVLEAVIGAAYIDGGLEAARLVFMKWFTSENATTLYGAYTDNPKGRLQEWAQQHGYACPHYTVVSEEGPAHARIFTVHVQLGETLSSDGTANSKRGAEAAAAYLLWQQIEHTNEG